MKDTIWDDGDLQELDMKFDALSEFLGIEFVFEKVSNGGFAADRTRCYARSKNNPDRPLPGEVEFRL